MDRELDKLKQKEYYQRNREKMNQLARERYHKKKVDPLFYKNMLSKNQEAYYKKINVNHRTEEEEEEYFLEIRKHIAHLRELDEKNAKPKMTGPFNFEKYHNLFHD